LQVTSGTRIGGYEIVEAIGAGGMGNVYRATDRRLGRDVAIKTLPDDLARDPSALARFEREARFLASLNHPNIAAIYGIEEQSGERFLVLELVRGDSLDSLLAGQAPPIRQTLRIAIDIASALAAAHEAGIVHRDLKPSNVRITPDGQVKLLDFGIAKHLVPATDDLSQAATMANDLTGPGLAVGTPAYMSPEQIRSGEVDKRSDIWSLGCLLYEMLSGQRAFPGRNYVELADSIRSGEPNWSALPRNTPERLRRLVVRCLKKDPRERLQDIADARNELQEIEREADRPPLASRSSGPGLLATIVDAVRSKRRPSQAEQRSPAVLKLTQFTFAAGLEEFPAWSPDGQSIAYCRDLAGFRKLFVQRIGSGEARQISTGDHDHMQPAWSADGRRICFVRAREPRQHLEPGDVFGYYEGNAGDIWSIDLQSLRGSRLVEGAFNPSLSLDGKSMAVDASWAGPRRIWMLDERGHNPQQVTSDSSEAVAHILPRWSPDGKKIVYQRIERTKFDLSAVSIDTRKSIAVTNDIYQDVNPVWAPNGRSIYFSSYRSGGMNIWRIPVDERGAATGAPQQLTIGAGQDVQVSISPDGKRLAYTTLRQNADIWRLPLSTEATAAGPPKPLVTTTREDSRGSWSPDGRWIAFNSDRSGDMNIWIYSLQDGSTQQITRGAGGDFQPSWSPNGRQLVFFSSRGGNPNIWAVDLESGRLTRLTRGQSLDINPFFSPDGTEIAYQSDVSGRLELWVMRADGSQQRQRTDVSVSGHFMRWQRDGLIYFRSPTTNAMMRVSPVGGDAETVIALNRGAGAHISFSPDMSHFIDVVGHKMLWLYGLDGSAQTLFEFEDSDVRIDYPVWSPDGHWLLFDRFKPEGGDIWIAEGLE
jgi:Tol biopolymer transport system component